MMRENLKFWSSRRVLPPKKQLLIVLPSITHQSETFNKIITSGCLLWWQTEYVMNEDQARPTQTFIPRDNVCSRVCATFDFSTWNSNLCGGLQQQLNKFRAVSFPCRIMSDINRFSDRKRQKHPCRDYQLILDVTSRCICKHMKNTLTSCTAVTAPYHLWGRIARC